MSRRFRTRGFGPADPFRVLPGAGDRVYSYDAEKQKTPEDLGKVFRGS